MSFVQPLWAWWDGTIDLGSSAGIGTPFCSQSTHIRARVAAVLARSGVSRPPLPAFGGSGDGGTEVAHARITSTTCQGTLL